MFKSLILSKLTLSDSKMCTIGTLKEYMFMINMYDATETGDL
jgi:hypothetical protein